MWPYLVWHDSTMSGTQIFVTLLLWPYNVWSIVCSAISEAEKTEIRARLISQFNEPVAPIATNLAVLISKVARVDCPHEWQELIPTLLEAVKQPDPLHQQRALLTLNHVTKTLASKRLIPDRKLFREVSKKQFVGVFMQLYCKWWGSQQQI